ncbi:FAD-containing oxidoreductase [Paraburkholderia lycopersici]|uniref:Pyruvate/2-oxoglutarate dehydrogenase complex, dihydrolipoamide dehydrogenase (E3) component n=1 Tax=Paraburkholderia lycopersici TaxID=416944 RepID=A0A1G6I5G0_9BURK|nr:FAD-containing oxidoreductase [Paraburkholderia lycopersici]SDC01690.1 Pyruvate/2-oxoglutarate dehydrogenase complex, dihydrolipoamide dehydrogenase (E3) component [Paraburkholderia lycopersici]
MAQRFDAIVIGTGQSGPPLAVRLGKSGRRTAVIERASFGGTCVNVGCTPTKAYVACARAAHVARHAADFGVRIGDGAQPGDVRVDLAFVKARKERIIGASRDGVERWLRGAPNVTVFQGHARFTGAHAVRVSAKDGAQLDLEAPEIFINTGTRAQIPAIPGLETIRYETNSTLLSLEQLPEHLAICGGSYVALEFAQMFRRFGCRVTVLVRGERVLAREDDDVSGAVRDVLAREGVEFRFGAQPRGVAPLEGKAGVRVTLDTGVLDASHLLFATGRLPNTDDLGLETAGVECDAHGLIAVDGQLRTRVEGIWALGDVNGRGAFTHTSYDDFQIVAANLLDGGERSADARIPAYAVFVDPPFARVGVGERQVRERGTPALIAKMPMSRVGRARERGETDGFMKAIVDARTLRILGAAIFGIEGDEAIHTFIDTMTAGAPYTTLQYAMHVHPTVSELVPTLLDGLKPLA